MWMSRALPFVTDKNASVFGEMVTQLGNLISGVIVLLFSQLLLMVSASARICNTASGSEGVVYSELIATRLDQMTTKR